jgi:hypothetical protein
VSHSKLNTKILINLKKIKIKIIKNLKSKKENLGWLATLVEPSHPRPPVWGGSMAPGGGSATPRLNWGGRPPQLFPSFILNFFIILILIFFLKVN